MASLAQKRLLRERKNWRRDHPFGFVARPHRKADGTLDLFVWDCKIPGNAGSPWEGGTYPVTLTFHRQNYPTEAPKAHFVGGLFHPNVAPDGAICLSLLSNYAHLHRKEWSTWAPSVTVKEILMGIQDLMDKPTKSNLCDAGPLFRANPARYWDRVRIEAKKYTNRY